ncbi:MAG: dephospho-CoA kinase [Gammaproteobacteria bacterium]|nr:dephospho-CoA kinase [Gammaproteobacteria bacterium]
MLVIGLTGGIGSGKSTVTRLFEKRNIPVIDTDVIARELVKPGEEALKEITKAFGDSVIKENGELDRQALAKICFQNENARKKLETILHPRIRKAMNEQIHNVSAPYVIAVIPLLFETGQTDQVDHILVVDCPEEIQIQRIKQRDNRDEQQIQEIIAAQSSRQTRLNMADDVIENQGDISDLDAKIGELHQKFLLMSQDEA